MNVIKGNAMQCNIMEENKNEDFPRTKKQKEIQNLIPFEHNKTKCNELENGFYKKSNFYISILKNHNKKKIKFLQLKGLKKIQ